MFTGKGAGINICAAYTNCRTCENIPKIVPLGIYTPPRHIGPNGIGRCTPLPTIAALQIGGTGKGYSSVVGGEGFIVAAIGAFLMNGIF